LLLVAAVLTSCSAQSAAFDACPCAAGAYCCDSGVCATSQDTCAVATAALSSSVRGTWTGYIENFQWSSDDSLRISIAVSEDGTISGHARIGLAMPPNPATDPSVPWPLDSDPQDAPPAYIPGFVYTAQSVSWQSLRLKFMIPKYEPWQPWCALQTSYPVDGAGYYCRADAGVSVSLCDTVGGCACSSNGCDCGGLGVCECDATGCQAGAAWKGIPTGYWFDVAFTGTRGDGSVNLSAGGNDLHNVRLMQISGDVIP